MKSYQLDKTYREIRDAVLSGAQVVFVDGDIESDGHESIVFLKYLEAESDINGIHCRIFLTNDLSFYASDIDEYMTSEAELEEL